MTEKKQYHILLAEAENALARSTNTAIIDSIALRDAVCLYFIAERERGATVEEVLRNVEDIVLEASHRANNGNAGSDGHHQLAQKLIDWCVQLARTGKMKIV